MDTDYKFSRTQYILDVVAFEDACLDDKGEVQKITDATPDDVEHLGPGVVAQLFNVFAVPGGMETRLIHTVRDEDVYRILEFLNLIEEDGSEGDQSEID